MSALIGIKSEKGVFIASESPSYTVLNTTKMESNLPIFTPKEAPHTTVAFLGDFNSKTMVRQIPYLLKEDKKVPVEDRNIDGHKILNDGFLKILQETYKVRLVDEDADFDELDSGIIASINDNIIGITSTGLILDGDVIIVGDKDEGRTYDLAAFNKVPESDDPIYQILKFYWTKIQDNCIITFPIVIKNCRTGEFRDYFLMDVYKYISKYEGGRK